MNIARLSTDTDADPVHRLSSFKQFIVDEPDVFRLPLDIDCDSVGSSGVADSVVLNEISVGPEVASTVVVAKQDSDLATTADRIVAQDIVGVVVADRCSVAPVVDHPVSLGQPELDAPAPEQSLVIPFENAVSN